MRTVPDWQRARKAVANYLALLSEHPGKQAANELKEKHGKPVFGSKYPKRPGWSTRDYEDACSILAVYEKRGLPLHHKRDPNGIKLWKRLARRFEWERTIYDKTLQTKITVTLFEDLKQAAKEAGVSVGEIARQRLGKK